MVIYGILCALEPIEMSYVQAIYDYIFRVKLRGFDTFSKGNITLML